MIANDATFKQILNEEDVSNNSQCLKVRFCV